MMDFRSANNGTLGKNGQFTHANVFVFISKANDFEEAEFENVIQIIDEAGKELNCTFNKFIEIFDIYGLEGFLI